VNATSGQVLRGIVAQTRMEVLLTLRRGENVLVTMFIPALLLVFFASLDVIPANESKTGFLLPGILALAVISTSMVSLGIATAFQRQYGVLKRLGGTPLPKAGLIASKIASVLVLELAQVIVLVLIATLGYGWHLDASFGLTIGVLLLGTATFAGIGLAMAGSLRAEATLALANGLYILFLVLGDIVMPLDHLPKALRTVSTYLPATAFSQSLRVTTGYAHQDSGVLALSLLGVWAVIAVAAAVRFFRWF